MMLTFRDALRIAVEHFGEPFAREGWEDDGVFLVTPQRVVDDQSRGLVMAGGPSGPDAGYRGAQLSSHRVVPCRRFRG